MITKEQKDEFNRTRVNLKAVANYHIRYNYDDAKDHIKAYKDWLGKMVQAGFKYDPRWEIDYNSNSVPEPNIKPQPSQTVETSNKSIQQQCPTDENKYCVLNIAWTESPKGTDTKTIELIDEYLKAVSEADIYDDSSDDSFEIEHIIKYKYKTGKQAFNVIKQSSQFIKDKIADPNKDQIEIFGKILGPS